MANNDIRQCMQKIEKLVAQLQEISDPNIRSQTIELIQSLMEMHGAAIEQMIALIQKSDDADEIMDRFARDELTSSLLMLYSLHPVNLATRVNQALEKVRPYLKTHKGNVELLDISDEGVVQLRLQGSCNGCPSSELTLKNAIEEAIFEFAPDINGLQVEGVISEKSAPEQLVQIG